MKSGSMDSYREALSGTGADVGGEPDPFDGGCPHDVANAFVEDILAARNRLDVPADVQRSPAEVRDDRARIDAEMSRNAENIHAITDRFKREADAMCSRLTCEWAHADIARAVEKYLAAYPQLDADTPQIEAAQRLQRLLKGGVL